jgi:glycosyltransferase involved in cell wall biosynthesis
MKKCLLIVQAAGDYREAATRLANGGPETYYGQEYSVKSLSEMTATMEVVVMCCYTAESYDELLFNRVRAIGVSSQEKFSMEVFSERIFGVSPTHLVLRFPHVGILNWAIRRSVKTLGLFAGSFVQGGLRRSIFHFRLKRALNHRIVDWIGNHNVNASKSLTTIGVKAEKIVPYDFPRTISPSQFPAKALKKDGSPWQIFYVGSLSLEKGVGDLLDAIKILKDEGRAISLSVVGRDADEVFKRQAQALEISDLVSFLGVLPNSEVVPRMNAADIVVVPSWHSYPEGFPLTIYHALCSRTPLVASDHPMFQPNLENRINSMLFEAKNPKALSVAVCELLDSENLYSQISQATLAAWESLYVPVLWHELMARWVDGSDESVRWIHRHRLSSTIYDPKSAF